MATSTNQALELLEEIRRLLTLRGENVFKIRAYEKAVHALAGREDLEERARAGTLTEIEGIGKGISEVLTEFFKTGKSTARDELAAALPPGMLELTRVPGLGPKKAQALIEELGVQTLGELEYACRENRLLKLKGFGERMQTKILEGLASLNANSGKQRLVDAEPIGDQLEAHLKKELGSKVRLERTGALRRKLEIVDAFEFIVEVPDDEKAAAKLKSKVEGAAEEFAGRHLKALPIRLHFASHDRFGYELARTTATPEHWKALGEPKPVAAPDEESFFAKLKMPWISPEARETGEEVELAKKGELDAVLPWDGVKGVFHNHTNQSDGVATLEQMVVAAKKLGYEYIGISDHSQSAFYAQGLKPDTLLAQEKEIRAVQDKHPDIRIFWGIESDILADGSLDYDEKVLKKFDFVIASIHSRFKMDRDQMTDRVLKAIRNPCTRFMGHLTGRLLLDRKGYDLDMEKVIAEAAKHEVAIEINAHPARLDIDWRWGSELRRRKTMVSVNPDAHEVAGLEDVRFGVAVARKALLPSKLVLNSRSAKDVEKWLKRA